MWIKILSWHHERKYPKKYNSKILIDFWYFLEKQQVNIEQWHILKGKVKDRKKLWRAFLITFLLQVNLRLCLPLLITLSRHSVRFYYTSQWFSNKNWIQTTEFREYFIKIEGTAWNTGKASFTWNRYLINPLHLWETEKKHANNVGLQIINKQESGLRQGFLTWFISFIYWDNSTSVCWKYHRRIDARPIV